MSRPESLDLKMAAYRWSGGPGGPLKDTINNELEALLGLEVEEEAMGIVRGSASWTNALARAGSRIRWSSGVDRLTYSEDYRSTGTIDAPMPDGCRRSFDLPSTGSLGNISPLVVPFLVLSARDDVFVPKMSADGGVTGTIDILESIGFGSDLSIGEYCNLIRKNRVANIAQTRDLAFSDKLIMTLRRSSKMVRVPALVVSSILSKKAVTGCRVVLVDVKSGPAISKLSDKGEWSPNIAATSNAAKFFAATGKELPVFFDQVEGHVASNPFETCLSELSCVGRLTCLWRAYRLLKSEENERESALARRCQELCSKGLSMLGRTRSFASADPSEMFLNFIAAQGGSAKAIEALAQVSLTDDQKSATEFFRCAAKYLGFPVPKTAAISVSPNLLEQEKIGGFAARVKKVMKFINQAEDGCRYTASLYLPALRTGKTDGQKVRGWIAGPEARLDQAKSLLELPLD